MRRGITDGLRCLSRALGQTEAATAVGRAMSARAVSSSSVALLQLNGSDSCLAASVVTPSAACSAWPSAPAAAHPSTAPFAAAAAAQRQSRSATTSTGAQAQVIRDAAKRLPLAGRAPAVASKMLPGIVHIQSTRNNTILTLTDEAGNTKAWASAGALGFKNARKCTSYAAEAAAEKLAADARRLNIGQVQLRVRGLGQGKQSSIKTLHANGLIITSIQECTPLPHNGCRPPKKRRI